MSREHCKIDAGPLAVVVTDLGSSKGTKFQSKDGKKIMAKVILPGQVRARQLESIAASSRPLRITFRPL